MSDFPTQLSEQAILNGAYDTTTNSLKGMAQGPAASNAPATGNPVLTGAKYNATPQTYDDGDVANNQADVNGNLKVTEATALAGEDLTNNVMKVEERFTPFSVTGDTAIKSGSGFVHVVTISPTTATPTAGLVTLYDSLTETGTVIYSEWVFATDVGHTIILDATFATGLYVGYDATLANVRISGSYR